MILKLCDEVGAFETNPSASIAEIQMVFNQLRLYAQIHFVTEEEILASIEYPELDLQRGEHDEYWDTLGVRFGAVAKGEVDYAGLREFLVGWWQRHILVSDMRYKEALKGLAPAKTKLDREYATAALDTLAVPGLDGAKVLSAPVSKESTARSEMFLDQLATLYPKCPVCGPEDQPKRCDAQRCRLSGGCDFAIREFLQIAEKVSKKHFDEERLVMHWIGDIDHEQVHREAHKRLLEIVAEIGRAYQPQGDRLKTMQDIVAWGERVQEHKRTDDIDFRRLWALREKQLA